MFFSLACLAACTFSARSTRCKNGDHTRQLQCFSWQVVQTSATLSVECGATWRENILCLGAFGTMPPRSEVDVSVVCEPCLLEGSWVVNRKSRPLWTWHWRMYQGRLGKL